MDAVKDERQDDDGATELDVRRLGESTTQNEVDASSGFLAAVEAIYDSCSEDFNETKNERTIFTTSSEERPVHSHERKKKKVKFCNLDCEECPPDDRVFDDPYLFTPRAGEYNIMQGAASETEASEEVERRGVIENRICDFRSEKNNKYERRKISHIPRLGRGSQLTETNIPEKEKEKTQELLSEIKKDFIRSGYKAIGEKNDIHYASSFKRPRTQCIDEARPSKFAKRLVVPRDEFCHGASNNSRAFSTVLAEGTKMDATMQMTRPTEREMKLYTNEGSFESKLNNSIGKYKKVKSEHVKIDPYQADASALLRKQNKLRIEQKKLLCDYTILLQGKTKSEQILDKGGSITLDLIANRSRIPNPIVTWISNTDSNVRTGKSPDHALETEINLTSVNALKTKEGKLGSQTSVNHYSKSVPVTEKLPRIKTDHPGSPRSNFARDESSAGNGGGGNAGRRCTELPTPELLNMEAGRSPLNGATRDKRAEGRKPLNRSCSNPGPASRKSQVQEMQQKKAEKINESTSNYTQEMSTSRSEVERLREEVHNHKRIIRQLSLRLPHESYKENQPLSLGHIPSTSVDNVFEAFLRPCRPRRDSSEAELQELVSELRAENKNLRSELQESRDQADLLEFRVLELTEGSDRFSEAEKATFIRDSEDKAEPPQLINFEDLSLPLSIDSGLDLTADGKRARCSAIELTAVTKSEDLLSSECRPTVQSLCTPDSEKSEASSSASGQASPDQSDEKQPDTAVYDASKQQEPEHTTDPADLPDIISNLQHYLDRPDRLQASLLATVEKLSSLTSSVSDLETKVSSMSRENQYLTDTLSSLNEAQETRTEASGTESEIVSRKTPSLHSDLSDSDSDSSSAADSSVAKKRFETLSNFQESGIFEGSSDVVHAASQTEDDGQVTTQAEESERLHSENARLVEALEELRRNYDQLLQNSANKCPRCVEGAEVDRGESRALKEQLRVSQGARKALYEEKCELEEAENDARLMVQRLDSQLTAAREMELLLSASLSQEQEISRELHKKVKELQYLQAAEKERSYRQSLMEKESIDEGAVSLILDKDTYASQLEFVKHSLILLHVFRHFHLLNSWLSADGGCEAPTEGLETVDEYVHGSNALVTRDGFERSHRDIDDALTEITSDQIVASQSSLKSPVAAELNFSSSFLSLDEMIDQHPKFSEFLIPGFADISVQTEPVELGAEFPGVQNKPESSCSQEPGDFKDFPNKSSAMNKVDVQSKSTMTVEKDLLSLRESFYLEQIEALQEEKSALRKESDQERSVAVEREGLLQGTVQDLQAQLLDCERARAALQCEIELQKEKEETLSKDFHKYMEQSRNDQARASELHEMEKAALRRDFEARIAEVMEDRRRHSDRCDELEHQLSALWRELECSQEAPETASYEGMPHAAATTGGEDSDQPASQRPSDAARLGCSSNMLDTIRLLVKSERSLRSKVTELEEKESAYRETIQEADQIMLSHVTSYKQRIDELEAANERCEAKVRQLECSEDRMRSSLMSNARCEQDIRVAELLEQLLTIERSELELKHKLWNIEKSEKELKIKVIEGEKVQESLRGELRDQDDLVRKMHSLQSENSAIGQQLQRAHESVRRAVDKQQTESLLKGRVEELEYSENALKNTLQQTYAAHALKERRLNQQVAALEEEVSSLKKLIENASIKEAQILESEVTLKRHVEALRAELQDAKRDLKMFSADECSSRTEVSRLRSQLKQANGDLTEAESINCSLRERLAASEQLKETLERSLEERKRRHESDLLQLNLQASQRESRLEETEGQLCELTQLHAAQELDLLAASPLEPLVRTTRRLTAQLCLCDACSQTHGTTIADLNAQLDTLTDLLSGAQHQDDSDGEEDGDQTLRSSDETTEKGADTNALTSVSDESVRYSSSSEGYGSNTISDVSTPLDENQHNRTGDSPRSGSPAPIPAPRRKRKLKRDFASSLRSSLKNRKKGGNTILEELEEKVRELEESINTKDEELKLADSEATDLSSKLAAAQDIAVNKEAEVAVIRQNMSELQRQLALSFENNEITKRNFELMYKEEQDKVQQQVERLGHQLNELQCRACVKDSIISALVANIRAFIKTCNVEVIIGQITSLREKMEQRRQRTENKVQSTTNNTSDEGDEDVPDHDVHTVCEMLGRPLEVLVPSSLDSPATSGPFSTQTADSAVQTGDALSAPLMVHRQIQTVFEPCLSEPFSTPVNTSLLIHEPASFLKTDEHNLTNPSPNGRITADSGPSDSSDSSSSAVEKSNVTLNRSLPSVHQSTQTSPSHFHKVGPHQFTNPPKRHHHTFTKWVLIRSHSFPK